MNEQQQINVKPGQLENSVCPNKDCQNVLFKMVYVIKKIPAMISPSGKNIIQPIGLYVCTKCGELNPEMTPSGVLSKDSNNV